ncbi:MAG TPA: sulfurtransferase [Candidatus Dormibacteraeota bacterium]
MEPLVDARWLEQHAADPDLRIIDFRWYLDGRSGRAAYEGGHIPGAVFVDLEAVTAPSGPGRHPIPSAQQFEAEMRAAGVSSDTRVVVYDDAAGSVAGRLWWLLRHFGHRQAAVLDGGLQAWGGPLSTDAERPPAGNFVAAEVPGEVVDRKAVHGRSAETLVLDARAGERYRGDTEPIDPRAGHIPGAVSAFWKGNLDEEGRLLPPEQLRAQYRALGLADGRPVIVHCGSGVNACHHVLAMAVAGLPQPLLYEGSWSDWSRQPDLPAATGPEP